MKIMNNTQKVKLARKIFDLDTQLYDLCKDTDTPHVSAFKCKRYSSADDFAQNCHTYRKYSVSALCFFVNDMQNKIDSIIYENKCKSYALTVDGQTAIENKNSIIENAKKSTEQKIKTMSIETDKMIKEHLGSKFGLCGRGLSDKYIEIGMTDDCPCSNGYQQRKFGHSFTLTRDFDFNGDLTLSLNFGTMGGYIIESSNTSKVDNDYIAYVCSFAKFSTDKELQKYILDKMGQVETLMKDCKKLIDATNTEYETEMDKYISISTL